MEHHDKGLLEFNGQSLIAHVIDRIKPQVNSLLINANRHFDDYSQFGLPVYSDKIPVSAEQADFKGPLAGLEIGLTHCTTPYLLTVPCDSPFLPLDLAKRLMHALQLQQADGAIACTGDVNHPQNQPVFCLLKTSMQVPVQTYLASGGRKMDGWFSGLTIARVYFEDESGFINLNTPGELQKFSTSSQK